MTGRGLAERALESRGKGPVSPLSLVTQSHTMGARCQREETAKIVMEVKRHTRDDFLCDLAIASTLTASINEICPDFPRLTFSPGDGFPQETRFTVNWYRVRWMQVVISKCDEEGKSRVWKVVSGVDFYRILTHMKECFAALRGEGHHRNQRELCGICMEREVALVRSCSHAFCTTCSEKWEARGGSCPYCRMEQATKGEDFEFCEKPSAVDIIENLRITIDTTANLSH
eukprot:Sspe_Gene.19245::Locus_6992_Transcript_2_2_Confidence_0.667_Length_2469::g.19245::m.19245